MNDFLQIDENLAELDDESLHLGSAEEEENVQYGNTMGNVHAWANDHMNNLFPNHHQQPQHLPGAFAGKQNLGHQNVNGEGHEYNSPLRYNLEDAGTVQGAAVGGK